MGDRELIEALRSGRNSAWAELVSRYLKLVCHVVRRTLGGFGRRPDEADVEDLAHELFASLVRDGYRALGTIGAPYDLKAWLAVSARRRAIDFSRRRERRALSLDQVADALPGRPEPPDEAEPAGLQAAVRESMAALSARERLLIQLFYLDGKKYREIELLTGINANSISPTLMRAIEKMQRHLAERDLLKR